MDILNKVRSTIERYSMLKGGEKVLIALSGGPDSVTLLHILNELKGEMILTLHALYIDHGLRPEETPDEIEFCGEITGRLSIPFSFRKIDVRAYADSERLNLQEAARQLRYLAFDEEADSSGADRIATGHNADDQVETLIMRLIRGSGPRGLSGIPPLRGRVIRPLIETNREEIEDYLKSRDIRYMTDTSNLKGYYLRNRIRRQVMPVLKKYNPRIVGVLCRTAGIIREEDSHIDLTVTKALMRLISRKDERRVELFLSPLENLEKVILRRVLIRVIEETRGLRGVGIEHIEDIISLIRHGETGSRLYLPGSIRAVRGYSTLIITSEPPRRLGKYTLNIPGETLLKEAGIVLTAEIVDESYGGTANGRSEALFDIERLKMPIRVRSRVPGDFFYPSMFGRRKKLQDYLVDEKVPRDERDAVPLLISGDDIIWVVGYRADERYRPEPSGGKRLRITVRSVRE